MAVTPQDVASAMAIFGRVLMQVDDEHLELETPCTDWNVEALISVSYTHLTLPTKA